jgi:hypothetical protein
MVDKIISRVKSRYPTFPSMVLHIVIYKSASRGDNLLLKLILTMAPLPLPERATPTPAGFLAALRFSEKDATTSTSWKAPSVESRARALELMSAIQREEGSKLAAWVQRRGRGMGRNEAMYATIRRLCDHALPLVDQVSDTHITSEDS